MDETKTVRVVKRIYVEGKRERRRPKKRLGKCNRELYEVNGCKQGGCERSSFVEVEDKGGRFLIVGKEGGGEKEEDITVNYYNI